MMKIVGNEEGFGMIQMMVMAGMSAAIITGTVKVISTSSKQSKKITQHADAGATSAEISGLMGKSESCLRTLQQNTLTPTRLKRYNATANSTKDAFIIDGQSGAWRSSVTNLKIKKYTISEISVPPGKRNGTAIFTTTFLYNDKNTREKSFGLYILMRKGNEGSSSLAHIESCNSTGSGGSSGSGVFDRQADHIMYTGGGIRVIADVSNITCSSDYEGSMLYNTTHATNFPKGPYYCNGSSWIKMGDFRDTRMRTGTLYANCIEGETFFNTTNTSFHRGPYYCDQSRNWKMMGDFQTSRRGTLYAWCVEGDIFYNTTNTSFHRGPYYCDQSRNWKKMGDFRTETNTEEKIGVYEGTTTSGGVTYKLYRRAVRRLRFTEGMNLKYSTITGAGEQRDLVGPADGTSDSGHILGPLDSGYYPPKQSGATKRFAAIVADYGTQYGCNGDIWIRFEGNENVEFNVGSAHGAWTAPRWARSEFQDITGKTGHMHAKAIFKWTNTAVPKRGADCGYGASTLAAALFSTYIHIYDGIPE